jgi:hypothetical protein
MAATAWTIYNEAKKYMLTADLDLDAALMRIKIVKGTAAANVSDYTRSTFASITGAPSNLKAPAIKSLTGLLITAGASAKAIKFDATDPIFTASGGAATSVQYAVIGISGGKALAWCKLSTAAFQITAGNTLTIQLNTSGIFTLTGGVTP